MEKCDHGVCVYALKNGLLLIKSLSRADIGLLAGHGKFKKLNIDDSIEKIGIVVRECLENKKPGFHVPHMYKEQEAHKAYMEEYWEDRGEKSDKKFNKGTRLLSVNLYSDRIEFIATNIKPGSKNPDDAPHMVLPSNASDVELGRATLHVLEMCIPG